jgi:hypothetical protein
MCPMSSIVSLQTISEKLNIQQIQKEDPISIL